MADAAVDAEAGKPNAPAEAPRAGVLRRAAVLVARHAWVRKVALSVPLARDVAWRFVAGEDLDAGIVALRTLSARGIVGSLNYVGTHVHERAEAIAAADAIVAALRRIATERVESHVSVKLTQVGLDVDDELCREQLRRILDAAAEGGTFVRIDMEESGYVERTIGLFDEVRAAYGPDCVGIVLQSYLRERADDVRRLAEAGARIRIVKGGYWEAPAVVFRAKADIDAAFARDVELLLRRGVQPAIATHDDQIVDLARRVADEIGLGHGDFEFQMLYGVRPDLQDALVRAGYRVRCYVPYGGQWYEYVLGCLRRLPGGALRRLRGRRSSTARARPTADAGHPAGGPRRAMLAVKRAMDLAGAAIGLVALAPAMAWIALAALVTQGRPILFRQQRPGLHGRLFTILKFRTMRVARPGEVWFRTDEQRVTRLGRFLRSTSLDELPELWNVIRGDMSLVGPRPLLIEYLGAYTPEEQRRHDMKPGITGWAAVNGRHTSRFEDRLRLEVWYVDHWSLRLDLRILGRTVRQVLRREGVATTQDFAEIDFPDRFEAGLADVSHSEPGADGAGAAARAHAEGGSPTGSR